MAASESADIDAQWNEMLTWLTGLPEDDPIKHETLGFIWMTCARAAWRKAERYKALEAHRSAREHRD